MPQIIPIKDLKNTSDISDLCHTSQEPIFITKNGYGDMVIMSMETYENTVWKSSLYRGLEVSTLNVTIRFYGQRVTTKQLSIIFNM